MNRLARTAIMIALANLSIAGARAQEPASGAQAQEGQRLAVKICAACHVVSPNQPDPPILQPPAPSFRGIANRAGTTQQSLQTFVQTTHKTLKAPSNMPNPELTDDQATAVVSYIMSLKKGH